MERLVYISTSRAVPDRQLVDDILAQSRRNNRREGLTGLLVVCGRRFLQVLEGQSEALDAAYGRIKADTRHFAMVELGRKQISKRAFAGWDMGCELINGADLNGFVDELTSGVDDADLQAQFRSFVEIQRKAA